MYPNVRAEMARLKITLTMLADYLGLAISTTSQKLNEHSQFTIEECKKIKTLLKTDMPLDELFKHDA